MTVLNKEEMGIRTEQDVVRLRGRAKALAEQIGMNLVSQTKLLTAASELVRNMMKYAGGGHVTLEIVSDPPRAKGVRLTFVDEGPGIADVALAMQDGYTTTRGLGLGLPGAKRLSNEFRIQSEPGKGTWVQIIRWQHG